MRSTCSSPRWPKGRHVATLIPRQTRVTGVGLVCTEHLVQEDRVPYRVSLIGNDGTDLVLKREINRF